MRAAKTQRLKSAVVSMGRRNTQVKPHLD